MIRLDAAENKLNEFIDKWIEHYKLTDIESINLLLKEFNTIADIIEGVGVLTNNSTINIKINNCKIESMKVGDKVKIVFVEKE